MPRTPAPPVPHPDHAAHNQWIDENRPVFIREAQAGFQRDGRGALMADQDDLDSQANTIAIYYMPERLVREAWDEPYIAEALQTYDPVGELIVLIRTSGKLAGYKIVFARRRPLVVSTA